MIAFHGTSKNSAQSIVGPRMNIDVTIGGGELGRGFYVGENVALAAAFAAARYKSDRAVIKIEIDDSRIAQLDVRVVKHARYVYHLWKSLVRRNRRNTYLFNTDVICAPFATIGFSYQYKFESEKSQATLNTSTATIV